jgi:hypothetical protein
MVGGTKLQNASDVVTFLQTSMGKAHLAYSGAQQEVRRYFHEIKMGDVNCTHGYETQTIEGCRSKHSIPVVSHLNKTLLHVCELSCFYKFYLDGGDGPCDNKTHAATFDLVTLEPCLPIDSMCDIETTDAREVSNDGEPLVTCLEVRDCFVVVAQDNTENNGSFWVSMCAKGLAYGGQRYACGCFWPRVSTWESSCHWQIFPPTRKELVFLCPM